MPRTVLAFLAASSFRSNFAFTFEQYRRSSEKILGKFALSSFFSFSILVDDVGILPVENKTKSTSAVQGKIRLTVAQDVTREKEQSNNSVEKKGLYLKE